MMYIRHYFAKAKEELPRVVVSSLIFMILLLLQTMLFNQMPKIFNHYSPASLTAIICSVLLVISCVLILGRKRVGVWLWLLSIVILLITAFIEKEVPGFSRVRIALLLLILVLFLFVLKKNGRTVWSVLK